MTTQDAGERSTDMKRMREEGMGMSVRSYGQLSSTLLKVYLGHRQNWFISSRGNKKRYTTYIRHYFIQVNHT